MKYIKAYLYALNLSIWGLWHGQDVDFWECYERRLAFLEIWED